VIPVAEDNVMEYLELLFRNVAGLLFCLFPFVPIFSFIVAKRELGSLLVGKGRCANSAFLFLVAPFKWARGDRQLEDREFDYVRIAFGPTEEFTVILWLTAQIVLTIALLLIIGPLALVLRTIILLTKRP
jgi:hypothetical protein